MKNLLVATLLLWVVASSAQQTLKNEIKQVTVFAANAQLQHETSAILKVGEQTLVLSNLSPFLVANSIRVRTSRIDAMVRQSVFSTELIESEYNKTEAEALRDRFEAEKRKLEVIDAKKAGLLKERELLSQNMQIHGQNGMNMTLAQFQQTTDYFRTKTESIQAALYDIEVSRKAQLKTLNEVAMAYAKATSVKTTTTGKLEILVDAKTAGTTTLYIDYLVEKAGWVPSYELRADVVGEPVALELKAKLINLTEVDWKNVKLIFSTGDPQRGSTAPMLQPWYITQPPARQATYQNPQLSKNANGQTGRFYGVIKDAQTGESIPYANIIFYDANGQLVNGTTSDLDGAFSYVSNSPIVNMRVSSLGYQSQTLGASPNNYLQFSLYPESSQLSEVVISSAAGAYPKDQGQGINVRGTRKNTDQVFIDGVKVRGKEKAEVQSYNATQVRKAITQRFEAKTPYTVKADGEELAISLQTYIVPVTYRYLAIPKLDEDAFLEAQLLGWDTLGLISGEMKLFVEGSYVGTSNLDAETVTDTLSLSMGRDPNVVIKRTNVPEQVRKGFMSGKRIKNMAYKLEVRNNKKVPITLVLKDQFPLSPNEDIVVKRSDAQGGKVDDKTGEITWEVTLQPGEQLQRTFSFEVTYPKNVQVYF
jgi:hypothetical protein